MQNDGAVYYTSPLFNKYFVPHAFFTRRGGVSRPPFDTLNFAVGLGEEKDSTENVLANHRVAAAVFGLDESYVCRTYQTHSTTVETVNERHRGTGTVKPPFAYDVDGLVTAEEDILLSVRSADCVPILLYDTENDICGAVHSGWRGTLGGISAIAINKMCALGARKENIIAAIGPCAGKCCYEVGAELYGYFTEKDLHTELFFTPAENGKYMLDLTGVNEYLLIKAGVKEENVSACRICTCCNTDMFFSHRVHGQARGTMASFIMKRRKNDER